jgi:hypothetical protein
MLANVVRNNVDLAERVLVENITVGEDTRSSKVEAEARIRSSNTGIEVRLIVGSVRDGMLESVKRPDPKHRVTNSDVRDQTMRRIGSPLDNNSILGAVVRAKDAAEDERQHKKEQPKQGALVEDAHLRSVRDA